MPDDRKTVRDPGFDSMSTLRPENPAPAEEAETILDRTSGRAPTPAAGVPVVLSSPAQFRKSLVDSGLIDPDDLAKLAAETPEDVLKIARALTRAGKLTAYQATAAIQGKTKGLVIGNYFILDKLGAGGMGVVFKARHRRLGRVVALKILAPSLASNPDVILRFRREVDAVSRLSHPNVIAAVDADEDRGVNFLAMDYVDGRDLQKLVAERGPLPVGQALDCVIQAARGLDAAHSAGIIHRDIKPGNLMLDGSGTVRVLDLGLARIIEASQPSGRASGPALTQAYSYMGTVEFSAPEQAEDSRSVDGRADIYSLACTLYYLLTARPPFEGASVLKKLLAHQERPAPSLRSARPDVPAALDEFYLRMMAKRPADRPASMAEVVRGLEACRVANEASVAHSGLRIFAEEALKRSPRGTARGRDASVFSGPTDPAGLQIGDDLNFEDVVADFRDEEPPASLVPDGGPSLRRIKPAAAPLGHRGKSRRAGPLIALGALAVLGLIVAGYLIRDSPKGIPSEVASNDRPSGRITPEAAPGGAKVAEATAKDPARKAPREVPKVAEATTDVPAWERSVAALPAVPQVEAVAARLKDLNPGFDGVVAPTIQNGVVTGLKFTTDHVTDISPVSVLSRLRKLHADGSGTGKGSLADLSPLEGMALSELSIGQNRVSDLRPLRGMPLEHLHLWQWHGSDLTPLKGMPLKLLNCGGRGQKLDLSQLAGLPLEFLCVNYTQVTDIAPLRGMKLTTLMIRSTRVSDLSPLKGMRLHELQAQSTPVSDLTPLHGMPLKSLDLHDSRGVTSLHPLRGMPLEYLNLTRLPLPDLSLLKATTSLKRLVLTGMPLISDLSPLRGLNLKELSIDLTEVADLSALKGMSLNEIRLTPGKITHGLEILRQMKSLRTIKTVEGRAWPAAEFWARYDDGEFR